MERVSGKDWFDVSAETMRFQKRVERALRSVPADNLQSRDKAASDDAKGRGSS